MAALVCGHWEHRNNVEQLRWYCPLQWVREGEKQGPLIWDISSLASSSAGYMFPPNPLSLEGRPAAHHLTAQLSLGEKKWVCPYSFNAFHMVVCKIGWKLSQRFQPIFTQIATIGLWQSEPEPSSPWQPTLIQVHAMTAVDKLQGKGSQISAQILLSPGKGQ